MSDSTPAKWQSEQEQRVFDCPVYSIFERRCHHPRDGRSGDFVVMKCPDWVLVLALTEDHRLILVNQFRFGSSELSWEVPGGVMDAEDASPIATALRELKEETGYGSEDALSLGWCYPNPALQENRTHFVLARNCRLTAEQELDPNEEIQITTPTLKEAFELLDSGKITHALAMNALFLLRRHLAGAPVN